MKYKRMSEKFYGIIKITKQFKLLKNHHQAWQGRFLLSLFFCIVICSALSEHLTKPCGLIGTLVYPPSVSFVDTHQIILSFKINIFVILCFYEVFLYHLFRIDSGVSGRPNLELKPLSPYIECVIFTLEYVHLYTMKTCRCILRQ